MNSRLLLAITLTAILILFGCASQPKPAQSASDFPELSQPEDGSELDYSITTYQYRGNEIGEIQDISGYKVLFKLKKLADGSTYYHFYRIEKADASKALSSLVWKEYDGIKEFKVIIDDSDDISSSKKYLNQIPHDGIETYNIYVSLMDAVMYRKYAKVALQHLVTKDDVYEIPPWNTQAADWLPVVRDIQFEETPTYLLSVGANDRKEAVYFYKNDNTKIYQTISVGVLTMPSKGTTRFMGFVRIDQAGEIAYATLSEYFTMEIRPMFFMKMNMLVRREQVLERLQ